MTCAADTGVEGVAAGHEGGGHAGDDDEGRKKGEKRDRPVDMDGWRGVGGDERGRRWRWKRKPWSVVARRVVGFLANGFDFGGLYSEGVQTCLHTLLREFPPAACAQFPVWAYIPCN